MRAIELFSGIGAFSQAVESLGLPLEVVQAYDQSDSANLTYELNWGLKPRARNIESLKASSDLVQAELWWMSPPCAPFSRRGNRRDDRDPRSAALMNLISLLPEALPDYLLLENVEGFAGSASEARLLATLQSLAYETVVVRLCSTAFAVPMKRPRYFLAASRKGPVAAVETRQFQDLRILEEYLKKSADEDPAMVLPLESFRKFEPLLNLVDRHDRQARLICFTSGYFRYRHSSGSLLRQAHDPDLPSVRLFSPDEIVSLLGFSQRFRFPPAIELPTRYRLAGNSVDVRAIKALLTALPGLPCAIPQ